jgi:predicted dehydrogenase
MKSIKIAFVGAGYMATEHAKAFSGLPGVTLAGVFSRTRTRAEQLASAYPGMVVCDSVSELHARTQADLVVVTVKELSMAVIAAECFAFPWAALLEKPAGYDLADATGILDAASRADSKAYVALNRRTYSSTRQALARLADNSGPRFVKVMDQQDQQAAREIYKEPPEVVRNYMYANSIHLIDYFRVFGRGEVTGVVPVLPWTPEKPGIVVSKIEFSSGDVSVVTPRERLEMRPLEQVSLQLRGERKVAALDLDPDDTAFKPGLRYQAMQAVAAVRGEPHHLPTLADSWQSMNLVARIFGFA